MSTYDNDVVYTLNQIEQPKNTSITAKQADVARLLHTYVGGAATYAADCPKCMDLARQIMLADGSWSDD